MDWQRKSLRMGAAVILLALILRLASSGFLDPLAEFLSQPDIASLLIYLETGRDVRFSASQEVFLQETTEASTEPQPILPVFTAESADLVNITYNCSLKPDLQALMESPLQWDLTGDEPTVLILHTHTTESYTKQPEEEYEETAQWRTIDENFNMIAIGDHLTQALEEAGITVIHDRQLHDYPSYNGSYNHARKSIASYLEEYPTIRLVLDLHRDASGGSTQQPTSATVDGKDSAQLMLVMGTNASGLSHPDWQKNLSLGLKLQAQLESIAPGICRSMNLRAQRFNQDMSTGSLLVEVGAAGNSRTEALTAVEVLARGIIALAQGAN